MAITIELPADVERDLRSRSPGLDSRVAVNAALHWYREKQIDIVRLAGLLGRLKLLDDPQASSDDVAADVGWFHFDDADQARVRSFGGKANEGELTDAEAATYDAFIEVDGVLSILRLRTQAAAHAMAGSR